MPCDNIKAYMDVFTASLGRVCRRPGIHQERLDEVEDFVDFLKQHGRDRQLTRAAAQVAERSFANVWDNSDDSIYDQL